MDNDAQQFEDFSNRRIDDVLGVLYGIHTICKVNQFREWMSNFHHIQDITDLSEGYKFVFNILTRRLHDEISQNVSLKLTQDRVFDRANFRGIQIHKLPNTCEKTKLLKNIRRKVKSVLNCKNWLHLEDSLRQFELDIVDSLLKLKPTCILNDRFAVISVDEAIKYSTMFEIYIFLNATHRGIPHGYYSATLDNSLWHPSRNRQVKYLELAFKGYKYAIQFLWFNLLGDEFNTTSLTRIHETKYWDNFDSYFEIIKEELINPLERKIKTNLGLAPLLITSGKEKRFLSPLLTERAPIHKPNDLEILEQTFLWYEIELVDASQDTLFNGIPAVVSSITGSIEIKRRNDIKEKTQVVRLIHPDDSRGNTYSYAILMEVTGYISDASGWLLFFACCYDFTGTGIHGLNYVENFIAEYLGKGLIEIKERRISKRDFLKLMKPYLVSATKEEMLKAENTQDLLNGTNDRLATSRGMILELLTYYMFSDADTLNQSDIEWNYRHKEIEIDVLLRTGNELRFFECKKPLSNLIDEANKFKDKAQVLLLYTEFQKRWRINQALVKTLTIVVWDRPRQSILKEIIKEGIDVIILSEEIYKNSRLVRKRKDKIEHVYGILEKKHHDLDFEDILDI